MSWLLTLQPQAAGSVAQNWHAGSLFDVSLVIFQDRILPQVDAEDKSADVVVGEYTLEAEWDALRGLLSGTDPRPFLGNGEEVYLDDEDIRPISTAGGSARAKDRGGRSVR